MKRFLRMEQRIKFKETEIGKIPEDWGISLVGEVAQINELSIGKSFKHDEIEYIDIDSVDCGNISPPKKMKLSEAPSRAKRIVRNDDILISTVRPNLKHFAYVNSAKSNTIASTGFAVISSTKIEPMFLYYCLTTERYTNYLSAIADSHTSTYPSFNPDIIQKSRIPNPSISEQRSIAKILSDLDAKIELNRQMNKTLEETAQAIFKYWFVDFEFPNENGKPYKLNGGKTVDSKLGKIPKKWEIGILGNIAEVGSGKRPAQKSNTRIDAFSVDLLGASSVMGYVQEALYSEPIIVTGRVGTHGVVQRITKPSWPSDNTLVIKPKYYEYVFQCLKRIDYNSLNIGSTQPLITQTELKNQAVLIPEKSTLARFEILVSELYSKVASNKDELDYLAMIRDSLLPKLMSGKIRFVEEHI